MKRRQMRGSGKRRLLESLVFSKRAADLIANDKDIKSNDIPYVDLGSYPKKAEREKEFKQLIMNEIERKDKAFYDKWCNNED